MKIARRCAPLALLMILAIVVLAPAARAQDETTVLDPLAAAKGEDVSVEQLEIYIKPLEKDDLVEVADAWKARLKGKAMEIGRLEAENLAPGADKPAISKQLTELRSERSDIVDRLKAVLKSLEAKGGDAAPYESYVEAVTGTSIQIGDAEGMWHMVKDWVTSPSGGIKTGKDIILFFVVLIAFKILASILGGITRRAVSAMKKSSDLLRQFFVNTVRKVTFLVGLVMALSMIGIDIGPLVAAIGAVGFIVAFALQGTLSNFAAGIMILLYRPYDVGEVVTISGVTGKVDAMSLVSTTLLTPDNQTVTVPNGSIWGGIITNITGKPTRRVDLVFGIGYGDDIAKAQGILADILEKHELVLSDPAPVIEVSELADSSVNFIVRPWAKTADYWQVMWDVTRQVKLRFDEEGVSIPFPQQDVHMHQVEA